MENQLVVHQLLEQVLGPSYAMKNGEYAFHCKFCNHHKKKFQVNLQNQHWHCWVCNAGGRKLVPLLYKINASKQLINQINSLLGDLKNYKHKQDTTEITLPPEYIEMWKIAMKGVPDPIRKHAINFCKNRIIEPVDMIRYRIGYCTTGIYANRLIIPSYNINSQLNYFVARDVFSNSTMKYKNPPVSKDVIVFEDLVCFNQDIVLVEGVMDAIAVRRNAVPMLGKFPSIALLQKLIRYKPKIYIALDSDAERDASKLTEQLVDHGLDVTNILFTETDDPSSVGFTKFWNMANKPSVTFSDILRGRLYGN